MTQPSGVTRSRGSWDRWLYTVVAACVALGSYIACSPGGGLTTPNASLPNPAPEAGGVRALASPTSVKPSPTNVRPSPTNLRPSPTNVGASPTNVQPSPSSGGGGSSAPGATPTPGPSGSPTPGPSGSPTPGPTPTPATCTKAGPVTFDAAVQIPSQIPFTTGGGNFQGPVITVNGSDYPNCTVDSVRVRVSATTGELADLGDNWVLRFDRPGAGPIGFDLIRLNGAGLSGTDLGTTPCGLVFENTGPDFLTTATPPYDGAFIAAGDAFTGQPGFGDYIGQGPGGDFGLYPAFLAGSSLQITCYRIEFVLK